MIKIVKFMKRLFGGLTSSIAAYERLHFLIILVALDQGLVQVLALMQFSTFEVCKRFVSIFWKSAMIKSRTLVSKVARVFSKLPCANRSILTHCSSSSDIWKYKNYLILFRQQEFKHRLLCCVSLGQPLPPDDRTAGVRVSSSYARRPRTCSSPTLRFLS